MFQITTKTTQWAQSPWASLSLTGRHGFWWRQNFETKEGDHGYIDYRLCPCVLQIEELPVTIGRLQSLEVLNLCNNRLTSLPSELGLLRKLHTLNLGLNQLDLVPPSIGNLEELRHIGLSDNRLTRVPVCLSRLKKLEKVNLDRNPIVPEQTHSQGLKVTTEQFYVVTKSSLCEDCFNKCQDERRKMEEVVKSELSAEKDWEKLLVILFMQDITIEKE